MKYELYVEVSYIQPVTSIDNNYADQFWFRIMAWHSWHCTDCSWSRQHEKLEKLNMQAIANASAEENEFVKEFLISEGKLRLVVEDLIATELWREKIFSQFIASKFEPKISFPVYMVVRLSFPVYVACV